MSMFWQPDNSSIQIVQADAPSSPVQGQQWYETDTDLVHWYNGSAFVNMLQVGDSTAWTPGLAQNGARATSAAVGRYTILGPIAIVWFAVTCNAAGSAGSAIQITGVPTAVAPAVSGLQGGNMGVGETVILDAGNTLYSAATCYGGANLYSFQGYNTNAFIGQNPSYALAAGDTIQGYALALLR